MQNNWCLVTNDQTEQPHPLADPADALPVDPSSSVVDATEDLERLAVPLLAIQHELSLLSRLLAR
ncbi:MAG: hypothetical protein J2P37_32965 [Ktedonobacteraceae bacterium]|nr:hypothetical protein [Ktedonobacteraceae bacterium]MBO0790115.1 hypothetical protein [Ktedonobacteraceae bacterium]